VEHPDRFVSVLDEVSALCVENLPVRAAGGVVVRGDRRGGFEVALIFRSTHR